MKTAKTMAIGLALALAFAAPSVADDVCPDIRFTQEEV